MTSRTNSAAPVRFMKKYLEAEKMDAVMSNRQASRAGITVVITGFRVGTS